MAFNRIWLGCLLSAVMIGGALPACNDSNSNPDPEETVTPRAGRSASGGGGKGGSGGSKSDSVDDNKDEAKGGSGGKGGAGGKSDSDSKGGSGGNGSKAGAGGSSGGDSEPTMTDQDDCDKGPDGCFCGKPSKDADFLNQCNGLQCQHYDNGKLKKLNSDGSVPAVP